MYPILISAHFTKQLKDYLKKYRHLQKDLVKALENPESQNPIHLGKNVYKFRLKCRDIQRGKSKSFRVIFLIREESRLIIPLAIYFKGDKEDVSDLELNVHLASTILELQNLKIG